MHVSNTVFKLRSQRTAEQDIICLVTFNAGFISSASKLQNSEYVRHASANSCPYGHVHCQKYTSLAKFSRTATMAQVTGILHFCTFCLNIYCTISVKFANFVSLNVI
jgi:hypothetical protein